MKKKKKYSVCANCKKLINFTKLDDEQSHIHPSILILAELVNSGLSFVKISKVYYKGKRSAPSLWRDSQKYGKLYPSLFVSHETELTTKEEDQLKLNL